MEAFQCQIYSVLTTVSIYIRDVQKHFRGGLYTLSHICICYINIYISEIIIVQVAVQPVHLNHDFESEMLLKCHIGSVSMFLI